MGELPRTAWRILIAVPVIAAPLCVLAIFPWLAAAQGDGRHIEGYAIGIVALVAYPIALAAFLAVAIFLHQRKVDVRRVGRRVYFGLFALLLAGLGTALILIRL